jgi:hypothetical protein
MMNPIKQLSFFLVLLFSGQMVAQNKDDQPKTIVISEFVPAIKTDAKKISETPSILDTVVAAPSIEYKLAPRKFDTYYDVEQIKPAKMEGEPLNKLHHGSVTGGLGNYLSLFGEGFYSSTRSRDNSWGAHIRHFSSSSSVGGTPGFSGYSDDDLNLFGRKFIGKHTLDADLNYARNSVYYYGDELGSFKHSSDSIHQYFNCLSANVGLLSHFQDKEMLNHSLRLKYYYLDDHYHTNENNLQFIGSAWRYLHEELLGVDLSADYYNTHSLHDTSNMTIVHLHPYVGAEGEKWELKVGLSAFGEFGKEAPFYSFVPDAEASYDIYRHIITPYVGLENGTVRNSYRYITQENPFVNPNVASTMENTRNKYTVLGGLRGVISSTTSYDAHVSFGEVENAAFFVNDTTDAQHNKFKLIYDDGRLFKMHGEIAYQKTEKLHFLVKGDYVRYFLYHEVQQWHTPTTRITVSAHYSLKEKIIINADIFGLSEQYAPVYMRATSAPYAMTLQSKTIKPLVDVNLGVEYRYTKSLSAFVHFNNIGATKYYRWNDYPTQAFNFLVGVSCIF